MPLSPLFAAVMAWSQPPEGSPECSGSLAIMRPGDSSVASGDTAGARRPITTEHNAASSPACEGAAAAVDAVAATLAGISLVSGKGDSKGGAGVSAAAGSSDATGTHEHPTAGPSAAFSASAGSSSAVASGATEAAELSSAGPAPAPAVRQRKRCEACGRSRRDLGGAKLQICAGCKAVRYCSAACQLEDWPRHGPQCTEAMAAASEAAQQA